jgi:hypothetical protein
MSAPVRRGSDLIFDEFQDFGIGVREPGDASVGRNRIIFVGNACPKESPHGSL